MGDKRQVWFWLGALAFLIATIALLGQVLLPFVAGAVIAYFLNPVADSLERLGLGRTLATVVILGLAGIAVFAIMFFLVPLAVGQLTQLAQTLPADLERAQLALEQWADARFGQQMPGLKAGIKQAFGEVMRSSSGLLATFADNIVSHGLAAFNLLSLLLVTPMVVFYLLKDWHGVLNRVDSWLPRDHAGTVRTIAGGIDQAVSAFVRGQGTICIILGIIYAIGLSFVGLKYGLIIGLATGVMAFVPIVGWLMGMITAVLVAISQAWPDPSLTIKVAVVYGAGMAFDSAVLSPTIVGQRVGLHPVWLIFALIVFSSLFGMVGTLVAVPVTAALAVIVRFARDRYLESSIYRGQAASPVAQRVQGGPET
ncbi:MAG: AI-2E family transporter [Hyphomicrobiaceae bacterium]